MGSLDFGKLTTIALVFLIVSFFFGGEIKYWYDHQDDLKFSMSHTVYTKEDFDSREESEKKMILDEVSSLCIRKHHADKLSCDDTAYWLANSLEDKGVESGLAIDWMQTCSDACLTGERPVTIEDRPGKRKTL